MYNKSLLRDKVIKELKPSLSEEWRKLKNVMRLNNIYTIKTVLKGLPNKVCVKSVRQCLSN